MYINHFYKTQLFQKQLLFVTLEYILSEYFNPLRMKIFYLSYSDLNTLLNFICTTFICILIKIFYLQLIAAK